MNRALPPTLYRNFPSIDLLSNLSHCLTSSVQVPFALGHNYLKRQLTWCRLRHFISFLFPSLSSFCRKQWQHSWPQQHFHSVSSFCTLPVKCYLVHYGLLARFCCAAGQSEHGLDRGSWWMVFPEPHKASSSLLHWCVDATQLAAQWVCTVYCLGRQMHMDAQC